MDNFFSANLSMLLTKSAMTPYALAKHLGTEPSTVYRWLDPEVNARPRSRTLVAIAQLFQVDPADLAYKRLSPTDTDIPPDVGLPVPDKQEAKKPIPFVELSSDLFTTWLMGEDISLASEGFGQVAKRWLPPLPIEGIDQENLIAIKAIGDALAPDIKDGDLVYIDFRFDGDCDPLPNGSFVLADIESNDKNALPVLRKLIYGDSFKDMWLSSTNPDWPGTKLVHASIVYGRVVTIVRGL